jgi:2-oxoglutarate dehydrogenase E2 component (dihydrolipoamide succinyltransferase)
MTDIKIPGVGESVREAVLAQWLKNDGDHVHKDDPILVIETDKVSLEVVAETDGVLHTLVPAGKALPIGAVIGTLEPEQAPAPSAVSSEKTSPTTIDPPLVRPEEKQPDIHPADVPIDVPIDVPASPPHIPENPPNASATPDFLIPSVRRLIERTGADIRAVVGTGPDGRITKGDVLLYLEGRPAPSAQPATTIECAAAPSFVDEPVTRTPMTPIRQRIAERLVQAKQQTAMLTTFNEIDMTQVMALRQKYKDAFQKVHGVSLGFMSFFIKACVAALKDFPEINASIEGQDVVYHNYYHIGVAVGSPRGLVVPVIRHADRMGFADIETAIGNFVEKIQAGKLTLSDLEGGTFTISNGGVYGSLLSTPILNPPQSAILGMHKIEKRPVVVDDAIVIRSMMYVALSYDHRIVDGQGAVSCLKRIKECIEAPERLMMEV